MTRPTLDVERRMDSGDWDTTQTYPHCDARILHLPEEFDYCSQCPILQEERRLLGVSNTGVANRQWPCPADRARSKDNYHAWSGNRPKKGVTLQTIEFEEGELGVKRKDEDDR